MLSKPPTLPARFVLNYKVKHTLFALFSCAFLYACSGESGVSSQNSAVVIKGNVLTSSPDLPISSSTQVFVDSNQNFALDNNETAANVKPHIGSFEIEVAALTSEQLESSFLVARNTQNTNQSYYLASPLSAYVNANPDGSFTSKEAVISPLTSMVSGEMISNQLSLEEAKQSISEITQNASPLENYVANNNLNAKKYAQEVIKNWQPVLNNNELDEPQKNFITNSDINKASLLTAAQPPEKQVVLSNGVVKPSAIASSIKAPATSSYIVVYKQGGIGNANNNLAAAAAVQTSMEATAQNIARQYGGTFKFAYSSSLRGFSLTIPNTKVLSFITSMQRNPNVDYIEEDKVVYTNAVNQVPSNWGLDRIDQNNLPLNNIYSYSNDGTGVNAYIIDTGIKLTHEEFAGRIKPGFSAIADSLGVADCKGHGTHVAGILGGKTYGVAKNVNIFPLKVFDCNGSSTISGIVAAMDWVISKGKLPGVVNMSLGISGSHAIDQAATKMHNAGFVVVASAGNYSGNACEQSPARASSVITVGSSDITDVKSYYSNYGVCIDLFAPGSGIRSAWHTSNVEYSILNGTSMSSPHVAGVAALILQNNPKATPLQVNYAILNASKKVMVGPLGLDSPNRLLRVTNTPDFTPVNQPIYVPPINSPLPPIAPINPPSTKPHIPFRTIAVDRIRFVQIKVSNTTWKTTAIFNLYTTNKGQLQEAIVTVNFGGGGEGLTCKTNSSGICTITSGIFPNTKPQTRVTITNVSGENVGYLAKRNKVVTAVIPRP